MINKWNIANYKINFNNIVKSYVVFVFIYFLIIHCNINMVRSCSLKNCNNSVKQKYRFFLLPSVKKVAKRAAWLKKCGHLLPERLPMHGNSISLCEGHFEPDQFVEYGPNIRTILKPTAVPTIFTRNPPRVCDAIESMYEVILDEESNHNEESSQYDDSEEKLIDKQLIMNETLYETDEKEQLEMQLIDNEISLTDKSKSLNIIHRVDTKSPPAIVQLLQIKKNRIVMSTLQSNKIIPTHVKDEEKSDNDEINSDSLLFQVHDNDQVKQIDETTLKYSSSPENNDITSITNDHPLIIQTDESRKKIMNTLPLKLSTTNKNLCSMIKKSDNLNVTLTHHVTLSETNINGIQNKIDELDDIKRNKENNGDNLLTKNIKKSINTDNLSHINSDNSPMTYSRLSMDTAALRKRVHDLEFERDNAIKKYRQLSLRLENFETNLRLFLNNDQIRLIESESSSLNTISWSAETLQKSAKIRCIVGPRAYEYLRSHEHYPLPSFRTLYRHRDISKINEYTDEIIQEHMNSTINELAAMGEDDSEVSDLELDDEHIKIEMLEPEYENIMEYQNDDIVNDNNDLSLGIKEITDDVNVMEYITVDIPISE